MTDTLMTVRDRLLKKLDEEMAARVEHFREQMRQLTSLQVSVLSFRFLEELVQYFPDVRKYTQETREVGRLL